MTREQDRAICERVNEDIFIRLNFPNRPKERVKTEPVRATVNNNKHVMSCAASFLASFMTNQKVELSEMDDYILQDTIGFGGFSVVRQGRHRYTGEIIAIKIIHQQSMSDTDIRRLDRELSIWRSLQHPNILRLQKITKIESTWYLQSEYCSGGTLLNFLNQKQQLTEYEARIMFRELCKGIRYLHVDRNVCHKDLKLDNILLDAKGHVKICDFGLTLGYRDVLKDEEAGGSLAYASPEQIQQLKPLVCPKSDIWSLGVILYTLVVGTLPFMDAYPLRLQQKILEGRYELPTELSESLKCLIRGCLEYSVNRRLDIDQVLKSNWLK